MPFVRLSPLSLGTAFAGKPLLASRKNDYPVYYQGSNLANGYVIPQSANDTFAVAGYLPRLPRCIRVFVSDNDPANPEAVYYNGLGAHLATHYAASKICVSWGASAFGSNARGSRFVAQATPGPAAYEAVAPEDVYAGEVLVFLFSWGFSTTYGSLHPAAAVNARFQQDYVDFVAKIPRHARLKVYHYQEYQGSLPTVADILEEAVTGSGVYSALGPGLSTMGWVFQRQDISANLMPYAGFESAVNAFFGL